MGSLASVAIFSALSSTLCELQLDFRFVRNGDNLRGMLASANVSLSRPLRSVGVWVDRAEVGGSGRKCGVEEVWRRVGRRERVAWRRGDRCTPQRYTCTLLWECRQEGEGVIGGSGMKGVFQAGRIKGGGEESPGRYEVKRILQKDGVGGVNK